MTSPPPIPMEHVFWALANLRCAIGTVAERIGPDTYHAAYPRLLAAYTHQMGLSKFAHGVGPLQGAPMSNIDEVAPAPATAAYEAFDPRAVRERVLQAVLHAGRMSSQDVLGEAQRYTDFILTPTETVEAAEKQDLLRRIHLDLTVDQLRKVSAFVRALSESR